MTRKEFLYQLEKKLNKIPTEERAKILQFYREYFDEAGADKEAEVIKELKSPAHLATKILAEYAEKQIAITKKASARSLKAFWISILAILTAPITFPLALGLLIVVMILSILFWVFIPIMLIVAVALTSAFVVSIFSLPILAIRLLAWLAILIGSILLVFYLIKFIMQKIFVKLKTL